MNTHRLSQLLTALLALWLAIAACGIGNAPSPVNTATPDLSTPLAMTAHAATQGPQEAQATAGAQAIAEAQVTERAQAAQATGAAFELQATQTRAAQIDANREATRQAVAAQATARSQSLLDRVQKLSADGVLTSTDGAYYPLGDFDESLAQLNYYQPFNTGHSPSDFVIRADASWESASKTADWWASGCGFVFRAEEGAATEYLAYLGLDGSVYFQRTIKRRYTVLGSSRYGKLDVPAGQAQIMLVAQGNRISFFVNDVKVHTWRDTSLSSGALAYTLVSGTNKEFGTRCHMTNVELWELK